MPLTYARAASQQKKKSHENASLLEPPLFELKKKKEEETRQNLNRKTFGIMKRTYAYFAFIYFYTGYPKRYSLVTE